MRFAEDEKDYVTPRQGDHDPGNGPPHDLPDSDQMAAAMIDRLAHLGRILLFEGENSQMKRAPIQQKHQRELFAGSWVI